VVEVDIQRFETMHDRILIRVASIIRVATTQDPGDEINRYLDGEQKRHYTDEEIDRYSVTTVIDELEGEKDALKWWRRNNDGKGDNPDWQHILEYKRNRGTLAHHAAMAELNEEVHGAELWSQDEADSLKETYSRTDDSQFLYSILADRGVVSDQEMYKNTIAETDTTIEDVFFNDMDWFSNAFQDKAEDLGINADTTIAVEKMFLIPANEDHGGYGGQVDLLYEDPETGDTVVADLKTSSAVRDKHKYQAAAYAKAVEQTPGVSVDEVDRAEIIRLYPDDQETEVYTLTDFNQYWEEFAKTTRRL